MTTSPQNREIKKKCPACHLELITSSLVCPNDKTMLMAIKDEISVGSTLNDQYELLSELGRGGMSTVYKAKFLFNNEILAVKVMNPDLISDAQASKRFILEGKAISSMHHPNLVKVHDLGVSTLTHQLFIAMECIEGESLSELIKKKGPINPIQAIKIFTQVCDALSVAHQNGIIHRDLKSSNIMVLNQDGQENFVKVVDFGIAKLLPSADRPSMSLTQTGDVFGSPIYMSPEQCLGVTVDFRSDIYALGIVMFEALTGEPPIYGHTVVETMHMHVSKEPPSFQEINPEINLPQNLEQVVLKSLNKMPANRYQTMLELKQALLSIDILALNNLARKQLKTSSRLKIFNVETADDSSTDKLPLPPAKSSGNNLKPVSKNSKHNIKATKFNISSTMIIGIVLVVIALILIGFTIVNNANK